MEIGRAGGRGRGEVSVGAGSLKKKKRGGPPRVQLAKAVGVRSAVKLTVSGGGGDATGGRAVSAAVRLPELPTGRVAGAQLTAVLVSCWRAVTTKVPELPRWVVSPA